MNYQKTYIVNMLTDRELFKYRVTYQFNNSKFGFQNSITVDAFNPEHAIDNAKHEISGCYGSKMLRRFSFPKTEKI